MTETIAVLMTCHNRVQKTLECLDALYAQKTDKDISFHVFLVDDGSTDGTSELVSKHYPNTNIILGDGSLFWNRGMHRAFEDALKCDFDFYLWLNDDTTLDSDAIEVLLSTYHDIAANSTPASIIVLSTRDPESGELSYGGYRNSSSLMPINLTMISAEDKPVNCVTFCGNVVLIPRDVTNVVGNIDPVYEHRWGDVDYGLRAGELGCQCWVAPGYHATCQSNPYADRWRNKKLSVKDRFKDIRSIKGLAKNDWKIYVRRHGGILWPLMWARPYLRLLFDIVNPF